VPDLLHNSNISDAPFEFAHPAVTNQSSSFDNITNPVFNSDLASGNLPGSTLDFIYDATLDSTWSEIDWTQFNRQDSLLRGEEDLAHNQVEPSSLGLGSSTVSSELCLTNTRSATQPRKIAERSVSSKETAHPRPGLSESSGRKRRISQSLSKRGKVKKRLNDDCETCNVMKTKVFGSLPGFTFSI
jgi:hypothetical protein